MKYAILASLLVVLCWGTSAARADEFDHTHGVYAAVLERYVKDGLVDYRGLKAHPEQLEQYLDQLADVSEREFNSWDVPQRLSYLINLYNARTLKLIVDRYPVRSIRKTAGLFGNPWKRHIVRLFGNLITLDILENRIIRRHYAEPAVQFALVRAAIGSPPLRNEPYVPDRLYDQLQDQGRRFLSTAPQNRVDLKHRHLYLSPIFKWYEEDFARKAGSVEAYVRIYFPDEVAAEMQRKSFSVSYTDFNWSLNDQATAKR